MDFARPELLWLLFAAPLAGAAAWWAWRRRFAAAEAWAARGLWGRLLPGYRRGLTTVSAGLLAAAVLALVVGLARPRWGARELKLERRGVDVVFVLDTSLSMATRDVVPTRFWVAQTLVRRLVRELPGHRVALVQTEGDAVVMAPLTGDSAVIDLLLDALQPDSLPVPGTKIAPALDRALALFPPETSKHQVVILVSDGEDHGQGLDAAAAALRERGVVTHTIGVGTREGKPLEMPDTGGAVEYKRDEMGQVVVSRLMEENLQQLSEATGGLYVRATSPAADLEPLVDRIQEMETRAYGSELVSMLEERFQWPVGLAVAALFLHLAIAPFRRAGANA